MRKTIVPWVIWSVLILGSIMLLLRSGEVRADAAYSAKVQDVTITLYNEPCKLTEHVAFPYRATWVEKSGAKFEGCWMVNPDIGSIIGYFREDKSIAVMPMRIFTRVQGV